MSTFVSLLRALLYGWIVSLYELLQVLVQVCKRWHRHEKDPDKQGTCFPVDHPAFVRPEPLLYSQRALMAQGLAVTWDNPDIVLFLGGAPVSSSNCTRHDVQREDPRLEQLVGGAGDPHAGPPFVPRLRSRQRADYDRHTTIDVGVKGSSISRRSCRSRGRRLRRRATTACERCSTRPTTSTTRTTSARRTQTSRWPPRPQFTFTLPNDTQRVRPYRFETDTNVIPPRPRATTIERDPATRTAPTCRAPGAAGLQMAIHPATPSLAPGETVVIGDRDTSRHLRRAAADQCQRVPRPRLRGRSHDDGDKGL